MSDSLQTDYGSIEVTPETLATIAGAAAVRCFGIVGMVPRGLRQGVSEILGDDALSRGVEITQDGSDIKRPTIPFSRKAAVGSQFSLGRKGDPGLR